MYFKAQANFVSFAANVLRRKGYKIMSRNFKTSQKNRVDYIYYTSEGTKIVITPGEDGVTEADIELLHLMDDSELDDQRRYEYRVNTHLDAYHDGENESANDRNKYLADDSANPEALLIANEDELHHLSSLDKLAAAMECLLPQQKELFKKVYLDKRSNTDIAAEEGVTEAAIRNRLKKMHKKIRKHF